MRHDDHRFPRDEFPRRVHHLDDVLTILDGLAKTPIDVFLVNPEKYGSAERFLQVALLALHDLGAEVVSIHDAVRVDKDWNVPDRLEASGLISKEEAALWRDVNRFHDVFVQDDLEVAHRRVHEILTTRLEDLRSLMRTVVRAEEQA